MFLMRVRGFCYGFITMSFIVGGVLFADEAGEFADEVASQKKVLAEEMTVIIDQHMASAKDLYNNQEFDKALEEFNTVLDIDKENKEAQDFRLKCISAIANNGTVPGESSSMANTETSKTAYEAGAVQAYQEGLAAFKGNRKEEAIYKLRLACAMDPNYIPSKRLLNTVLERTNEDIDRDHDVLWRDRINDVRKAWLPTGKANKITLPGEGVKGSEIISDSKRKMLNASQQIIPEINFTQAHLRDVLQYLSKITGVNIILDERVFDEGGSSAASEVSSEGTEGSDAAVAKSPSGPVTDTITITLTNIPLIEALRYILKIKGLKYRIDDFAIMVSTPEGIGDEEMETRYYHLSSGIGDFTEFKLNENATTTGGVKDSASSGAEGAMAEGPEIEGKTSIKDVLLNSGCPFPTGSNVFMDRRTGTLIVHNTPENLTMVEKILDIIDKAPFQVNIQAKFVKIIQSDLEEMGFEWMLNSAIRVGKSETLADGTKSNIRQIDADSTSSSINNALGITDATGAVTSGASNGIGSAATNLLQKSSLLSFSGILTDPQFKVIMHALDKNGNTDLLSAPSVTTVNNQQAQIELVDEIRYPNEYDLQPPTISESGLVTPGMSVPGEFTTRDVGVILNVTPSVGSDRKTITLTLIPEVSELKEWTDFGVDYNNTTVDSTTGAQSTQTQHIPLKQPVFRTSNVSTTVIVNDGETVVLGGMIEEKKFQTHDKVPLLGDIPLIGRLFKHDYEQSQKTNLMIFVTAKLINADGEDLHTSQKK